MSLYPIWSDPRVLAISGWWNSRAIGNKIDDSDVLQHKTHLVWNRQFVEHARASMRCSVPNPPIRYGDIAGKLIVENGLQIPYSGGSQNLKDVYGNPHGIHVLCEVRCHETYSLGIIWSQDIPNLTSLADKIY